MKNVKIKIYFILMAVGGGAAFTGCVLGNGGLNTLQLSDRLEQIPFGTSYSNMTLMIPQLAQATDGRCWRSSVGRFAFGDPADRSWGVYLYRQYPRGVLLTLTNVDHFEDVPVGEGLNQNAEVDVFFDSEMHYKGYCAYSNGYRPSKDSKTRLEMERNSYRELRIAEKFKDVIDVIKQNRFQFMP